MAIKTEFSTRSYFLHCTGVDDSGGNSFGFDMTLDLLLRWDLEVHLLELILVAAVGYKSLELTVSEDWISPIGAATDICRPVVLASRLQIKQKCY